MPNYDFQCEKCQKIFEIRRSLDDRSIPKCQFCEHQKTKKLISAPGIVFKGKGFYKTDSIKTETKKQEIKKTKK